jgi:outer membrane protein OmpA-like peptidoglycan-associated protein
MDDSSGNQSHWIPLADLMTGLMMVFMLLTAAFMLRVEQTTTLVVQEYKETRNDMHRALQEEFKNDLKQWDAEILGDMTIRFKDPTALFPTGSSALSPKFKELLREFFPRYVRLITSPKYKDTIKEIRIEGHTSAFWMTGTDSRSAYFFNMELSQARTRSALAFLLSLKEVERDQAWLLQHVTANGLSSSKPLVDASAPPRDQLANQRVEFRIVTNASDRMDRIAEELQRQ